MTLPHFFILIARFEAFTWAGLLVGMLLEHVLAVTDLGVWLFGRLHGGAFIVYFFTAIVAGAGVKTGVRDALFIKRSWLYQIATRIKRL